MTTPLLMLSALDLGLSLADMDSLTIGMLEDMAAERSNDSYDWPYLATQEDFDTF